MVLEGRGRGVRRRGGVSRIAAVVTLGFGNPRSEDELAQGQLVEGGGA